MPGWTIYTLYSYQKPWEQQKGWGTFRHGHPKNTYRDNEGIRMVDRNQQLDDHV
jgi:hypothetical protein